MTPVGPRLREYHLHLYGCLTPEDLLGELCQHRARQSHRQPLLEWYATEFERVRGRQPYWRDYWQSGSEDLLALDYLILGPTDFASFQASFNLLIALFKLDPREGAGPIPQLVLQRHQASLGQCDYRVLMPWGWDLEPLDRYLCELAQTALELRSSDPEGFRPFWAMTLQRNPEIATIQFQELMAWMQRYPSLAETIIGVDICGSEVNSPPSQWREFIVQVQTSFPLKFPDRAPLKILFHVGEQWGQAHSPASAARWVFEIGALGVDRIGHGLALAVLPSALLQQARPWRETVAQHREHLEFIRLNRPWLVQHSYPAPTVRQLDLHLQALQGLPPEQKLELATTPEAATDLELFQHALRIELSGRPGLSPVVECCPTSNMRLAGLLNLEDLGLRRWDQVHVVVGTDNPGILATDLAAEHSLARQGGWILRSSEEEPPLQA